MEKNFDEFFEDFNNKKSKGEEKFRVKATGRLKSINELFDNEKLKGEHEIPYMQGEFGPEGKLGKELVTNISKTGTNPVDLFHTNLAINFAYVTNLEFMGYTPLYISPTRVLYELPINKSDGTHMIRGKASLDFTINDINGEQKYTYYYNHFIQGQDVKNH